MKGWMILLQKHHPKIDTLFQNTDPEERAYYLTILCIQNFLNARKG
jgi:hypothetical protein